MNPVPPPAPPPGPPPEGTARPGLWGLAALVLAIAGSSLWVSMLTGPLRLGTGLLAAADHLEKAESHLARGAARRARYDVESAGAAAERAHAAFHAGGPLFDLARRFPRIDEIYGELPHLVGAARHSARAAAGTLEIAESALRGPDPVIKRSDEGSRIDIDRVRELRVVVAEVRDEVRAARRELRAADQDDLPRRAARGINDGIRRAGEAIEVLKDAQLGFDLLPDILGEEDERIYLIAFQNTAEQRGTGGAILQFRLLRLEDGRPELLEEGGTIYDIDRDRRRVSIPLPEDAWLVEGIPDAQRFGNANWSPDWPLSSRLTIDYGKATPGSDLPDIDGVIGVDPLVLHKLLPGVGPYRTEAGNRVSRRKVVDLLLYRAYAAHPVPAVRRIVLGQVVNGFYERLFDPENPTLLLEGMGAALTEKNMQIWMAEADEQALIEQLGWDGAIAEVTDSDYAFVVEQNVGGNKLDYFDDHVNTFDVRFEDDDALVSAELRVHNGVFLPQPRYSMGDTQSRTACATVRCPVHRPMMNLYVADDAELLEASVDGRRLDTPPPGVWTGDQPPTHFENGKKVWSATLEIAPGDTGAVRFDYRVPGVVVQEGRRSVYRLHVQRQPKVRPEELVVRIALPDDARAIRAPGWERDGDQLVWQRPLMKDTELEVSWRT